MAPMIDVVFQLLIFFMLTLKIIEPEGDFNINMPIGQSGGPPDMSITPIEVQLIANEDGTLRSLNFGTRSLGTGDAAFQALNEEILRQIGEPGNPQAKDTEATIDADYGLNYEYVIRAVGAVTGRVNPETKQIDRYIEKVKFAPPKPPAT